MVSPIFGSIFVRSIYFWTRSRASKFLVPSIVVLSSPLVNLRIVLFFLSKSEFIAVELRLELSIQITIVERNTSQKMTGTRNLFFLDPTKLHNNVPLVFYVWPVLLFKYVFARVLKIIIVYTHGETSDERVRFPYYFLLLHYTTFTIDR